MVALESESHGCLDPKIMSQISIATGVPAIPIHPEMTMMDDMISPPSSASIDKQTPDFSISEHSYPSQMTPLASFFSLEATDAWRNQASPPFPLWDPRLDQEWETLLTGDDFDLNAVNMSLLSATSQYIPTAEVSFDLDTTTSQPLPVDHQAKQHNNTVQRKWHTFCEIASSGQMTPDVPNEESYIDETYRKRLADRLQQRVQTGILPSTPFLVGFPPQQPFYFGNILIRGRIFAFKHIFPSSILSSPWFTWLLSDQARRTRSFSCLSVLLGACLLALLARSIMESACLSD